MRLSGRQDALLLYGLALALVVIFARPVRYLLDLARDIETSSGLALVPALVILTGVFLFHQVRKRQEMNTTAASAATAAQQALERANELEELVVFGQTLARSLDLDTLREVVWLNVPGLVERRKVRILLHASDHWEPLMGERTPEDSAAFETVADQVLFQQAGQRLDAGGVEMSGYVCFRLVVGDRTLCILGVTNDPPLSAGRRRIVAAAAALLAIAVRNA